MSKARLVVFLVFLVLAGWLSQKFYYNKQLGYEFIPSRTETIDERSYAAAGLTFRRTGIPTTWTNMDAYVLLGKSPRSKGLGFNGLSITLGGEPPSLKNASEYHYPATFVTDVNVGKGTETITVVQPFLDHPLLGGVIYSLGLAPDTKTFSDINPSDFRRIALYVSVITGLLLFLTSYSLSKNPFISLFALIIYSATPTFVLTSRFALLENILIPLSLLVILFLSFYSHRSSRWFLLLAGISAGLCLNTKESGLAMLIAGIVYLYISRRPFKSILWFAIPAILVGSAFYVYALALSPALFRSLFISQTQRGFFGSLNFLYTVLQPHFQGFPLDGYWLWGLVSIFLLWPRRHEHLLLFSGFLSTLFVFLLFGSGNYPWYVLPFIPFYCLAIAFEIWELIVRPAILPALVFLVLPFSSSFYWGYSVFHSGSNPAAIYRLFLVFFTVFAVIVHHWYSAKPFVRVLWIVFFVAFLYQMHQWNLQSIQYIIANWLRLPPLLTVPRPV